MEISRIEHGDPEAAEELRRLLHRSYAVEADLIGAVDFPPLRRSAEDIRTSKSTFHGGVEGGRLVAAAELEHGDGGAAHIASLVVDPDTFRRGFGAELLGYILDLSGSARLTVSTATANLPAIGLYEKRGFRIREHWSIDGIDMVTMERSGSEA